jgi:hypothetical protein
MTPLSQNVAEFVKATEALMTIKELSDDERKAVNEVLHRLSIAFPDEGDDAAD